MATLSTTVGQTSLGNFIFSGLQTENWISVLVGCAAVVVLALIVDQALGLIESGRGRAATSRRMAIGLAVLVVGTAAAALPRARIARRRLRDRGEEFLRAVHPRRADGRAAGGGRRSASRASRGSAPPSSSARSRAATSTPMWTIRARLWTNVLARTRHAAPRRHAGRARRARCASATASRCWARSASRTPMRWRCGRERATAASIATIADLAPQTPRLKLGSDLEFLGRPEWAALKQAYGLAFAEEKSFNPTFMYRALADGSVDVISAFSSDGRIAAEHLVVLADVKHAIPAYDAVILISPRRRDDAVLRRALAPLIGAIPVERMRRGELHARPRHRQGDRAGGGAVSRGRRGVVTLKPLELHVGWAKRSVPTRMNGAAGQRGHGAKMRLCPPYELRPFHRNRPTNEMAGASPATPVHLSVSAAARAGCSPVAPLRVTARSSRTARCRPSRRDPAGCSRATCARSSRSAGRWCRRCLRDRRGPAWRCRRCCSTSCCRSG